MTDSSICAGPCEYMRPRREGLVKTYALDCGRDGAHDDEVVQRERLVPLVREFAPEDTTVFVVEHRQALERRRVLRDDRALLDDFRVLRELVRPRELGGVGHELLVREAGEGVRELRI